jgi:hypothetical protein
LLADRKYRLRRLTHLVNAPGLVKPAPSLPFTAFLPLQLPNLGLYRFPRRKRLRKSRGRRSRAIQISTLGSRARGPFAEE